MIIELLVAGGIIGGLLIVAYWDEIVSWFKNLVYKIKEKIEEIKARLEEKSEKFLYAMGAFIEEIKENIAEIKHKLYTRENGEFFEETTRVQIPKNKVPQKYLRIMQTQEETDVTEELEEDTGLILNN